MRAIRHADDELKMPPKRRLPGEVITAFAQWVAQGADWPEPTVQGREEHGPGPRSHWAFQRIKDENRSDIRDRSSRPIDRFIEAKRRIAGVKPVRQAERRTLIRRVTFDLIGLPPTPQEVADFVH